MRAHSHQPWCTYDARGKAQLSQSPCLSFASPLAGTDLALTLKPGARQRAPSGHKYYPAHSHGGGSVASPALLSLPQGPVFAVGAPTSRPALSPCAAPAAPWRPGALACAAAPSSFSHHAPAPPTTAAANSSARSPRPARSATEPICLPLTYRSTQLLAHLCTPVVQVCRRAGTGQPEGGRREQARLDARGGRGGGGHGARPCAKQSKAAAQRTPRQKLRPPARPPAHPVYSSARSKHMAPPPPRPIRQLRPGWPAGHPALFGLLAHN